ncbi:hypothetical protein V5F38_05385 [Xanthobacter sp. V0B-10]|uniref:hypothetical protein n=1 Tax=Xanthobacter albus TaxID=3119929 RepID=UPI0037267FAF
MVPTYYRRIGCDIPNEPLGSDYAVACGPDGKGGKAATLNAHFDEWDDNRRGSAPAPIDRYGTVGWLFRTYKASKAYLEKVSPRSRPDYERVIRLITECQPPKGGPKIGERQISAVSPAAADAIYAQVTGGEDGRERLRQGEKMVTIAKKAWAIVRRLHPNLFDQSTPNPWDGVAIKRRVKGIKAAVTRDDVYTFAWGAIDLGHPEAAAAAVICFEWLQRPENVLAGYVRWSDYRSPSAPQAIKIEHHKTGEAVLHPLDGPDDAGGVELFYAEAEEVLRALPRRGVPMILKSRADGAAEPFTIFQMARIVRKVRAALELPETFTLDACRHGGMTELEEAGLTDGQGRALSAHRSRAYDRYAKRTYDRALNATRKRHAHRIANSA